jgi:hypothetical protein
MITLDEPWFCLSMDHPMVWFQSDEKVAEKERHTIHPTKLMLTIIWNRSGFHLINVLPNGCKFNAIHYSTHIQGSLRNWRTVHTRESN